MNLNEYGEMCHKANAKWWPPAPHTRTRNKGEAIVREDHKLEQRMKNGGKKF